MAVLVAYASAHGSTGEIAERIAARLAEQGVASELSSVATAGDLPRYDAFVVGSAIHSGNWLPEGAEFLDRNRAVLSRRPVWLFSVSSVGEHSSAFPARVARRMRSLTRVPKAVQAVSGDVRYRDHHAFAGVVRPTDWGISGRTFLLALGGRFGDHRDWQEIDGWAVHIAGEVRAVTRHSV